LIESFSRYQETASEGDGHYLILHNLIAIYITRATAMQKIKSRYPSVLVFENANGIRI
jgi:hypothetical protein